jgi:zinc/manganese transport system substrate-binding protein
MNIILSMAFTSGTVQMVDRRISAAMGGLAALLAVATLAACGSDGAAAPGTIAVVTSTNVYGDIARQIGGDRVRVTSLISDPDQDPHSYEATPQNQLALSRARVIVENGGGYDDFVDTMRHTAQRDNAIVLNAVQISGRKAAPGESLNEHVWYDFPTVRALAARLGDALTAADPSSASTFRANVVAFTGRVAALQATEGRIAAQHAGTGVAITEPVPLYLLEACGLVNRTPAEFSQAIEEGTDVSPRVLRDTLALFSERKVAVLAYNEQTSSPETQQVLAAAKQAGVAVVPVTETLPTGTDYATAMSHVLTELRAALDT